MRENRTPASLELASLAIKHHVASDVARHQIGCELDPAGGAAKALG